MLDETKLQEIKCITLTGENVVITAAHFDALLSTVRELQRQVQEREVDARRYRFIRPASFTRPLNVVDDKLNPLNDEELDAAIDAAMTKEQTHE